MEGTPTTEVTGIESIIREGRQNRWSHRQIAAAVRSYVVAGLVRRYMEREPCFLDAGDIVEFEKFVTDGI